MTCIPELVSKLSEDASTRKTRSIEVIHNICQEQYDRGSKDFSIATISRLSKECDGPSEQTIRNKNGADYRAILKAWAEFSEGFATKQKIKKESTTCNIGWYQ